MGFIRSILGWLAVGLTVGEVFAATNGLGRPPLPPLAIPQQSGPAGSNRVLRAPVQEAFAVAGTNLVFDALVKEYKPAPGEMTAEFTFAVTNAGPVEATINWVRTSCGCTVAKLPPTPWKLAPGEGGAFSVSANLRGKFGLFQKAVMLDTSEGQKTLTVKVNIPAGQGIAGTDSRTRNMQIAQADRQIVFRHDCASCHAQPTVGRKGEALYQTACGICHEAEHRATMVPDLKALKTAPTAEYWEQWIRNGKVGSLMPAFAQNQGGPLTDEQIQSLVEYLSHYFPPRQAAADPQKVED